MDANEARHITASAHERMSREQLEAIAEQQRLEQAHRDEILADVVATRSLIDAAIIKAAKEGKTQTVYNYEVRIAASRNDPKIVDEIKAHASEVITGVMRSLEEEGFSQLRGESRDMGDIRQSVGELPEYHDIPLTISWPGSAN
jgi:hypothetical protein